MMDVRPHLGGWLKSRHGKGGFVDLVLKICSKREQVGGGVQKSRNSCGRRPLCMAPKPALPAAAAVALREMKAKTRRRSGCLTTWACLHNTRCRHCRSHCRHCRHVDFIRVKFSLAAAAAPGAPSLRPLPLPFPAPYSYRLSEMPSAFMCKILICLNKMNRRLSGTWAMYLMTF